MANVGTQNAIHRVKTGEFGVPRKAHLEKAVRRKLAKAAKKLARQQAENSQTEEL